MQPGLLVLHLVLGPPHVPVARRLPRSGRARLLLGLGKVRQLGPRLGVVLHLGGDDELDGDGDLGADAGVVEDVEDVVAVGVAVGAAAAYEAAAADVVVGALLGGGRLPLVDVGVFDGL